MHYLDNRIAKIESEINDIIKELDKAGDTEYPLRKIFVIHIDSWIAWKTLRFLLRTTHIEKTTHQKWIQTPSSMTYGQLNAIWHFGNYTDLDNYITDTCYNLLGQSKMVLTKILEQLNKKRQKAAHFAVDMSDDGSDDLSDIASLANQGESQKLTVYYKIIKNILDTIERFCFLKDIHNMIKDKFSHKKLFNKPFVITWKGNDIHKIDLLSFEKEIYDKYTDIEGICIAYPLTQDSNQESPHFCLEFNTNNESGWGVRCHINHKLYNKYKLYPDEDIEFYPFWKNFSSSHNIWKSKQYYRQINDLIQQIDHSIIKSILKIPIS